jgi:uncharacterized protein YebE (UPF0316 family)
MVKNLKLLTAAFGFLEAIIYIFGLAIVLSGEQSILEMVIYAFGFSLGLIAGIIIEQKLAIGYSSFHVNINNDNQMLVKELRDRGYGVTTFVGEGFTSNRLRLDILTKRKKEAELIPLILAYEPKAFIIAYEPKMFKGGYLSAIMQKKMKLFRKGRVTTSESKNVFERTIEGIKSEVNTLKKDWKK